MDVMLVPHSVRPERRFPKQKKPRAKWGAGLRKETVVLPWGQPNTAKSLNRATVGRISRSPDHQRPRLPQDSATHLMVDAISLGGKAFYPLLSKLPGCLAFQISNPRGSTRLDQLQRNLTSASRGDGKNNGDPNIDRHGSSSCFCICRIFHSIHAAYCSSCFCNISCRKTRLGPDWQY